MGVTKSCSILPRSFSRTMAVAVIIGIRNCNKKPTNPGTIKKELFKSGLYQSRGRKSIGATVTGTRLSLCIKPAMMAWPEFKATLAGLESVPSIKSWTLELRPAKRSLVKSGGIMRPAFALPRSIRR